MLARIKFQESQKRATKLARYHLWIHGRCEAQRVALAADAFQQNPGIYHRASLWKVALSPMARRGNQRSQRDI